MIKSERLVFKPVNENDIEWLRETRNKYRDHFFDANEITKEQQKAWYQKYRDIGTDNMFIVMLKSGEKIGTIALYATDITSRTAKLGRVLLLEEFRQHGYAEEMVKRILRIAFEEMKLYKVRVEVHMDNIDAIAIYARAGFKSVTKPIQLLEAINHNFDSKKPSVIYSYDDLSDSYENQATNIKDM
jgi:RimJ/RimL family protein N-acetyltransferase